MDPTISPERRVAARRLRLIQTALSDAQLELGETYAYAPMFSHKKHGIVLADGTVVTDHQSFDWGSVADRRSRLWARVEFLQRLKDRETKRLEAAGGSWVDIYTPKHMGLEIQTDSSHAQED